jgi:hypothetical protein
VGTMVSRVRSRTFRGRCARLPLLLFLPGLLLALPAAAEKVPERLNYKLSWMGISIGTAVQEITDERDSRRIVSWARASAWVASLHPVDDRTETVLAPSGPFPGEVRSYRMVFKEGGQLRDREITFEPSRRLARVHDRVTGSRSEVAITPPVYDACASFYYVRFLPLEVGTSLFVVMVDGPKPRRIEVKVLRRERISVPVGKFDTIVVQPMVPAEGSFEGKRGVTIWLTDDNRRLPVKAQTKVKVGTVTAVLTGGSY